MEFVQYLQEVGRKLLSPCYRRGRSLLCRATRWIGSDTFSQKGVLKVVTAGVLVLSITPMSSCLGQPICLGGLQRFVECFLYDASHPAA